MSVKGEFLRLSGDAAASLRDGSEAAEALADELERIRKAATQDLAAGANDLLELWRDDPGASLQLPAVARDRFGDASERLLAVARIILGNSSTRDGL